MQLSASSWVHGASCVVSRSSGLLRTASPSASWKELSRVPDRKLNSSVLLSSTLRKLAQLPGMLLTRFPFLVLVMPLRDSGR